MIINMLEQHEKSWKNKWQESSNFHFATCILLDGDEHAPIGHNRWVSARITGRGFPIIIVLIRSTLWHDDHAVYGCGRILFEFWMDLNSNMFV